MLIALPRSDRAAEGGSNKSGSTERVDGKPKLSFGEAFAE